MLPGISVIIPVYNGEHTIGECLQAVYSSDYKKYEVIVVDDSSTDSSIEIIKKFPCRLIRRRHNAGAGTARNTGARYAKNSIIAFIDADIIIQEDSLRNVASHLGSGKIDSIIGRYDTDTIHKNFFTQFQNFFSLYAFHLPKQGLEETSIFWTGFCAIQRSVFVKVGGFNPQYRGATVEDVHFGYKLITRGYPFFIDHSLQVKHNHHYSLIGIVKNDYVKSRLLFLTVLKNRQQIAGYRIGYRSAGNLISVASAAFTVFFLFLGIFNAAFLYGLPAGMLVFIAANSWLFRYVLVKKGLLFTMPFILFSFFIFILSAVSITHGFLDYVRKR